MPWAKSVGLRREEGVMLENFDMSGLAAVSSGAALVGVANLVGV